jgi:hypothetical protein
LAVESLEDRTAPAILFGDNPGLTTSDLNGPVLANAQVRVIFWGQGWLTWGSTETQINNAVDVLNSSTYFYSPLPGADLSQYRPYSAARPARVASFVDANSTPGATFTDGDVRNMLSTDWGSAPNFFYYVIPNPGSIPTGGFSALHGFVPVGGSNLYYGWTRNFATPSLDDLTVLYSHEMVESISDPNGLALQVNPRNASSWHEICDGEAQNYTYRLGGVLAQSYWSQQNGKFTVPTGQIQNFLVSSSRVLTVNGDQLGANYNDTIILDVVGGGVRVTLNGETAQFEPGAISSVVVNTGGGTDTVNVLRTTVPVTINYNGGGGTDAANFGTGGSVQGIQAPVTVFNGPSYTHVNIDDSADPGNHGNVTINSGGVTGLAPAAINFSAFSVNTLSALGGTGTNTYMITATPALSSMVLHTGHAGSGNDTVNVQTISAPLTINGDNGRDAINIGSQAPNLNGTLANITQPISVTNTSSLSTLSVDDSGDGTARTGTISGTSITGLGLGASAAINYTGSQLNSLTVRDSAGGATVAVAGTSTITTLWDNGPATINIGNGNRINGITGALTLENEPNFDTININDQNDPVFQTGTLSTSGFSFGRLTGLVGVAPIYWDYIDTAQVNINTGSAGIRLSVLGTGVPTFINGNPTGSNTLVGGNLQTTWNVTGANQGNLSNALASATFTAFQNLTSGSGNDGFYFSNAATLSGTLNGGGGSGVSLAPYTANLTVNINGAGAGNIPGVAPTFLGVQYMTAGMGNDRFVFTNAGSITSIDGGVGGTDTLDASAVTRNLSVLVYGTNAGTVPGMVFEFGDIENITTGSGNATVVFSDGASLAGTLTGGSGNNLIDASAYATGRTFSITSANGGSVAGMLGVFANVKNLIGAGAGGNVFAFSGAGSVAGDLDGGVGNGNMLDYAAYPGGVTVNLAANSATGVGHNVVNIQILRGGAGNDSLTGNGAGGTTFLASPGNDTVTGLGSGNTLVGTNADSTWNINGTNAGTLSWAGSTTTFSGILNLTGGAGADDFIVSSGAGVTGTIDGGGGNNTIDTSAYTSSESFTVNGNLGAATVAPTFTNIQTLIGGNGGNVFNVRASTAPLTINTGTGSDQVNVGSSTHVITGIGSVTVNDASHTATVTMDDTGFGGNDTYTVTNSSGTMNVRSARTSLFALVTTNVANLNLNTGNGNDVFNVESTAAATATTINAGNNSGSGQDLVNISPTAQDLHTIAGSLTVNFGTTATNNQIKMYDSNNAGNPSNYTVSDTGTTVDTIPGFVLNYNFAAGAGIVDIEDTSGSIVTNNTVSITAELNGNPV